VKVLHATFVHPTDLPGKASAGYVNAFNSNVPGRGGFELELVERAGAIFLRITVPWHEFSGRGRAAWFDQHDPTKNPLSGLGRVIHVPLELCRKLEFAEDMEADMARLAAEKGSRKKNA
jgi:hypothetical protein